MKRWEQHAADIRMKLERRREAGLFESAQEEAPSLPPARVEALSRELTRAEPAGRPDVTISPSPAALHQQAMTQLEGLGLSPVEASVYTALLEVTSQVAYSSGYSPRVSEVHVFMIGVELASCLNIGRTTLYKALRALRSRGLVAHSGRVVSVPGFSKGQRDGTVFKVRMNPRNPDTSRHFQKITPEWFKHFSSDLLERYKAGATAYAEALERKREQLEGRPKDSDTLEPVKARALASARLTPSLALTVRGGARDFMEAVWSVAFAPRNAAQRRELVEHAGDLMAAALGDPDSKRLYYRILWNALRLKLGGRDYFGHIANALSRTVRDKEEGRMRAPGAVFVATLREMGVYDEISRAPRDRIAALVN